MQRRGDALASAVRQVLEGFGVEVPKFVTAPPPKAADGGAPEDGQTTGGAAPEERPSRARGKGETKEKSKARDRQAPPESEGQPAVKRLVDPTKARELLLSWLVKKHKMPRQLAESPEGVSESITQQRVRGGGAPLLTCTLMIPSLQLGPLGGTEHLPKRKAAIAAAYAAAVDELGVPVPPKAALSAKALAKKEMSKVQREEKAEMMKHKQREQAERRAEQKAAAKSEAESKARERTKTVFGERLAPQVLEALPGFDALQLPDALHVTKGGSDRADQRAVSDLGNLCNRETSFVEGPPLFFDRTETIQGLGSAHFVVAMVKLHGVGGQKLPPVIGCAFGAKRGTAKSAAARQCLRRIDVKASLPVALEMNEELQRFTDAGLPHESWAALNTAVSEIRMLEKKGVGGLRLAVVETAEQVDNGDGLAGHFRCLLVGRIPQEGGLRDFRGSSVVGQRSRRLAVATACQDATTRLSALFGGGDVGTWLRRMAVTPMELDDLPRDVATNLWSLACDTRSGDQDVAKLLDAWWKHRATGRRSQMSVPDLSAGPCLVGPQLYRTDAGGREDPQEDAKRKRGVPLLPVRSLRRPLAQLLADESVMVVSGGTGSGKSTQLPQYILDDWLGLGEAPEDSKAEARPSSLRPRIVVTQPRRIAAISVAERVAWERGEQLGQSVGYSVRGDAKPPKSRDGSIEFCTVGILLRRLMDARDPDLQRYTHVLVDEVHERDLMTDFLLILLKELLVRRGDVRVILMSATLDVTTFSNYFWECPVLEVPSGPRYPVEEVYLDDLIYDPEWEMMMHQQIQMQAMALQQQETTQGEGSAAAPQHPSAGGWHGTVVGGGLGALNPGAAEFVPGSNTWAPAAGVEGAAESGEPTARQEAEDEEKDDEGEEGEDGEDGDEDEEGDDDDDDDDDEDGEDDAEDEKDQAEQAPRVQEHVSWDLQNLASQLLAKEEGARRVFQAEQEAAKAEKEGQAAQGDGEVDDAEEGDEGGDPEALQGCTTGLWWGSFEDGDALLDLCARLLLHLVFRAEAEQGGIFDEKGQPGSILTFLPGPRAMASRRCIPVPHSLDRARLVRILC